MGRNELTWLAAALRQPGYKLPGYDDNGDPITAEVILACLEEGLIEPWVAGPGEPLPKVCRLTEKGELIAEAYLHDQQDLDEPGDFGGAAGSSARADESKLDDLLSPEDDSAAWWPDLPEGDKPAGKQSSRRERGGLERIGPAQELPPLPRSQVAARRARHTAAEPEPKSRKEERQEALAQLRQEAQSGSRLPSGAGRVALSAAKFAGAVALLAAGFISGWMIDPPLPRQGGEVLIGLERVEEIPAPEPGASGDGLPRLEDVLSISPAAGPGTQKPARPNFLAPIQPDRAAPPFDEHEMTPEEKLPALRDPSLEELWDRVDAAPYSNEAPAPDSLFAGAKPLSGGLEAAKPADRIVIERIPLPGASRLAAAHKPDLGPEKRRVMVQLASYRSEEDARAAGLALQQTLSDDSNEQPLIVEHHQGSGGGIRYLLNLGSFENETAAQRFCKSLGRGSEDCLVVTRPAE